MSKKQQKKGQQQQQQQPAAAATTTTQGHGNSAHQALYDSVTAQGTKIRNLKSAKADKVCTLVFVVCSITDVMNCCATRALNGVSF